MLLIYLIKNMLSDYKSNIYCKEFEIEGNRQKIHNFHCTGKANEKFCVFLPALFIHLWVFIWKTRIIICTKLFVFCFSHIMFYYICFIITFKYSKYCFKALHNTPLCNGEAHTIVMITLTFNYTDQMFTIRIFHYYK